MPLAAKACVLQGVTQVITLFFLNFANWEGSLPFIRQVYYWECDLYTMRIGLKIPKTHWKSPMVVKPCILPHWRFKSGKFITAIIKVVNSGFWTARTVQGNAEIFGNLSFSDNFWGFPIFPHWENSELCCRKSSDNLIFSWKVLNLLFLAWEKFRINALGPGKSSEFFRIFIFQGALPFELFRKHTFLMVSIGRHGSGS